MKVKHEKGKAVEVKSQEDKDKLRIFIRGILFGLNFIILKTLWKNIGYNLFHTYYN